MFELGRLFKQRQTVQPQQPETRLDSSDVLGSLDKTGITDLDIQVIREQLPKVADLCAAVQNSGTELPSDVIKKIDSLMTTVQAYRTDRVSQSSRQAQTMGSDGKQNQFLQNEQQWTKKEAEYSNSISRLASEIIQTLTANYDKFFLQIKEHNSTALPQNVREARQDLLTLLQKFSNPVDKVDSTLLQIMARSADQLDTISKLFKQQRETSRKLQQTASTETAQKQQLTTEAEEQRTASAISMAQQLTTETNDLQKASKAFIESVRAIRNKYTDMLLK